jgi:hypothetical protein
MDENDRPETPDDEGSEGRPTASPAPIPPAPPIDIGPSVASPQSVNLRVPLVNGLPPQQVRWTILVRLLLAIPQLFVLIFVGIATFFVAVAVWFVALFTGRVPEGMGAFLARFTRWSVRVNAYVYLLTDEYPAFDGNDDDRYPIGVEIPELSPLNQMAVLFRIVLALPAYMIGTALSGGLTTLLFPLWLSALFLGRLPSPIYRVAATVTRYSARSTAYMLMLTPEYPWGWKGDDEGVSPSGAVTSDPPVTRFDFHLTGWARAWVWIFIVIGLIYNMRVRRY